MFRGHDPLAELEAREGAMTGKIVYEVPPAVYLERCARARRALEVMFNGEPFDALERKRVMDAIKAEVDPLPLVLGVTYRLKVLGGPATTRHVHVENEAGEKFALDIPDLVHAEFQTVQGIYAGRMIAGPWHGLLRFEVPGVGIAALADMDVQSVEEMR